MLNEINNRRKEHLDARENINSNYSINDIRGINQLQSAGTDG